MTVRGEVVANLLECAVDLECVLEVRSKRGMLTIEYESGELEECLNPQAASHGFGLQPGDRIEVFARVTAAATVSTCGSERYFIRLSEAEE